MRFILCALALAGITATASAQTYQVQPNAVLQVQRANILDGVWNVGGLGQLSLTTRPEGALEGQLAGKACHGQYQGNAFSLLCMSDDRGPYLISGAAFEEPPVATTARARIVAQPARMGGQIHQTYLTARGHTEEVAQLNGTRQ
ncbi:hypothetical protein [Terricaulis silvestris]|uniref:DUF306 domain-containing protein n=1 Tax=Terricaulis silvestris TaxID=2686094 RepID=A0A6I6MFI2_9CAUL|nr:hypothetical protein [Terricaulis silvestris]QGZ93215.1 hypothetical protein DSM104635_00021 [Terricaulis silvestris]